MTALYKDGTVTLVQGSPDIVGNDTGWKVALIVGGTVFVEAEGGSPLPILPDDSDGANLHPITNTQMTAAIKWTGASGTYNYAIVRDMSYSRQQSANADALALYLQRLNNPSLAAVSGLVPEADSLILFTGPDTATVIQRSSLVQGVDYDEDADDITGRNFYSSEAKGFSVLVANAGDGRTAIFIKRSNTDGDWSVPFYISGPKGDKGDIGATGITDKGNYSAVAAYVLGDAVLDNGSTWRAKGDVPAGNAPPVLPAEENAYWRLLARKGTDGNGTGDVKGPESVTAGNLAQFADATGKLLGRATIGSPAFLGRVTAGAGDVERLGVAQVNQALGGWEPIGALNLQGQTVGIVNNLGSFVMLRVTADFYIPLAEYAAVQVSSDNGATFQTAVGTYQFTFLDASPAGTTQTIGTLPGVPIGNGVGVSQTIIYSFNKPRLSPCICHQYFDTGTRNLRLAGNAILYTAALNAIRIQTSSVSAFNYGQFLIEGIRG